MIQYILRCVVLGSPARVTLVPDVNMRVDQYGYDRLARQIDLSSAGRCLDCASAANSDKMASLNDERPVLERCAPVANNQTATFKNSCVRLGARLQMKGCRQQRNGSGATHQHFQRSHVEPFFVHNHRKSEWAILAYHNHQNKCWWDSLANRPPQIIATLRSQILSLSGILPR